MDEAEWLATKNPTAMLEDVSLTGERKFRLFSVACCRRVWMFLPGERSRQAVRVAERFADQLASAGELAEANRNVESFVSPYSGNVEANPALNASSRHVNAASLVLDASELAATGRAGEYGTDEEKKAWDEADSQESHAQADLLRDIFGNPFRPATFSRTWRTATALALATQMYESRDFGAMPILADALQDAGCDNQDILSHCRSAGSHVRGCWVVDQVLGKE